MGLQAGESSSQNADFTANIPNYNFKTTVPVPKFSATNKDEAKPKSGEHSLVEDSHENRK